MVQAAKRLDALEPLVLAQAGQLEKSVYGVVDKINADGTPHFIRKWQGTIGDMRPSNDEPTIFIIEKLEPCILKHKKYKCLFGGRAGTKSIMAMDSMAGEVNSCGSKVFVMRERMKSLKESIYAGINDRVKELKLSGFLAVPTQWEIRHRAGGKLSFGGLGNVIDMKGSFKYKFFLMEEAARTSQQTIDILGPTLRGVDGAELWYIWNNESSNDPMSKEFITPYQAELDRDGYYEDDYHLIIKVGYQDNPWFMLDQSLRQEFEKDTQKLKDGRMSKARYNHIWNGHFNDDIENSAIETDWFDACIDAHVKLGFEPTGAIVASHDPSDVGNDAKGFAIRHGVVFTEMEELDGENANRAFDVACRKAKERGADTFGWDCDGMGALLRDQAATNFKGTKVQSFMYKGSEGVHQPEAIFAHSDNYGMKGAKKNKDVFKNKKAQNIISFAERCRRTYDAVINGKYHDPDTLISFSTEGISPQTMSKLRAECCRMPLKPADKICFYSKEELRRGVVMPDGSRVKIPSPNLFDSACLSFDQSGIIVNTNTQARIPPPIKSMGRRC
jgi:phage terminase large subunit